MADESLNFRAFGTDVSAGRMFGDLADKADDARNSIHDLGGESKTLDERLEETRTHLRALIDDFEKTGDTSLFRDIRRDRSHISMLESLRKEIATEGSGAFSQGLTEAFSNLPWGAILGGAGLAALLAPEIGAAVAGAVLGGAGLGGIVGGVIAAAQDERVAAAGTQLGQNFMSGFKEAGRVFINPLLDQMQTLEHAENVVLADLASGFAALAPVIKPVAEGLEGFAENLNLDKVFGDAVPAVRAIANEMPEIGSAIGDALSAIGDGSDGAIEGLVGLLQATEDIIRGTGEFIGFLSDAFDWLLKVNNAAATAGDNFLNTFSFLEKIPGVGTALGLVHGYVKDTADETYSLLDATHKAKDAGDDWSGSLASQARNAQAVADAAKQYADAIDTLFGKQMNWDEAQIHLRDGMRDLIKELTTGKRTLAENSAEGDKNRESILQQIGRVEDLRDAYYRQTGSLDGANKMYDVNLEKLRDELIKLGYNKTAVDKLIDSYKNIPAKASTKVEAPGLSPALQHAQDLDHYFDELDGRNVKTYVSVYDRDYRAGERNPSGRASGGPVMAGTTYWVGEQGPELVTFGANGYVHNASSSRSMTSGGSPMSVESRVVVDVTGADREWKSLFLRILRTDAGFRATVKQYVGA